MSKPELIKWSGWAFIAGSFAFLTILSGSDAIAFPGSIISAILLAAGMLNLRAGYGENVSRFGRNILLMGVIGMVLWYVALASLIIMYYSGTLHATEAQGERLWPVIFGGPAVVLFALTLFGLIALRNRLMSRLNGLPLLAGIWYPAAYSFLFGYILSHDGVFPDLYWSVIKFTFLIQFFALWLLGLILIVDSPKEIATA
jgi:hypothetical protein